MINVEKYLLGECLLLDVGYARYWINWILDILDAGYARCWISWMLDKLGDLNKVQ
jgi:hypothetical protein